MIFNVEIAADFARNTFVVRVSHSADATRREIGSRMGGAAKDKARAMSDKVSEYAGVPARFTVKRLERVAVSDTLTTASYRLVPVSHSGELRESYTVTYAGDRPCDVVGSFDSALRSANRHGRQNKVETITRNLRYFFDNPTVGQREFATIQSETFYL